MTTAADGPARGYRLTMWLAHRQPYILAAVPITNLIDRYAGDGRHVWSPTNALATLAATLMLVAFVAATRHDATLCLRCARKTPLDGPAEAAAHDRALRTFHWAHGKWAIGIMTVLVVALIPAAYLGWFDAITVPLFLWFAVEAAAGLQHRPLQPWCPYCHRHRRWDEDGDPEPSPTPDPSGVQERVS
jgi:hypothetical protein